MVRTASLFSQSLAQVPRHAFAHLAGKHDAEYQAKGVACWVQFTAMLFCQFAWTDSLRQICNGLAGCLGKLNHLGIQRGPNRSDLFYPNANRPAAL